MSLLIVGICPNPRFPDREGLSGSCSEANLLELCGLHHPLREVATLVNLVRDERELFNAPTIRLSLETILSDASLPDRVVFLGSAARRGLGWLAWLKWTVSCAKDTVKEVACAPHPSGRNRWLNSSDNRRAYRRFWLDALVPGVHGVRVGIGSRP